MTKSSGSESRTYSVSLILDNYSAEKILSAQKELARITQNDNLAKTPPSASHHAGLFPSRIELSTDTLSLEQRHKNMSAIRSTGGKLEENVLYSLKCEKFRMPTTNPDFWLQKFTRNRERDIRDIETLLKEG